MHKRAEAITKLLIRKGFSIIPIPILSQNAIDIVCIKRSKVLWLKVFSKRTKEDEEHVISWVFRGGDAYYVYDEKEVTSVLKAHRLDGESKMGSVLFS